ncbi:carbonic anhydrase family protein [Massilia sp. W12]|uniref:carbonic anhydrase n=1 Tax=Massilia sp. W12 TaxID=3126507 RepID=UPI0030CC559C
MRILKALIAAILFSGYAWAADSAPPASAPAAKPAGLPAPGAKSASAPASAAATAKAGSAKSAASAPGASPAPAPAAESPPSAAAKGREEMNEIELSTKIAQRLAALRAQQAEKAAHAATSSRQAKRKAAKVEKAAPPMMHSEHWSYEGELGPRNWGKINPDWIKCASGNRQSPIDIRDGMKVDLELINFDYRPSGFTVVNNGHTIQVGISGGNFITIMGRTYELMQFHFHRPSEEKINGRGFEMVAHLVHKDPEGRLAVVAVLIERGRAQPLIQTIWNNLPLEKNDVVQPSIVIDMNDLLPNRRDYFTYMGSLTTPPCSEGVLWMVMKEPVQASGAQLALFSRLYPMNARPIQPNGGRVIKESN